MLDQLYIIRYTPQNYPLWKAFILEDLRIDEDALAKLDLRLIQELGESFESPKITRHVKWLVRLARTG